MDRAGTAPHVRVVLTDWEMDRVHHVGKKRMELNSGNRNAAHYSDVSRQQDRRIAEPAAAACECAAARSINRYWHGSYWSEGDHQQFKNTPDVGENVEVRRIRYPNARGFAVGEKDRDQIVMACYVEDEQDLRVVRVLGWIHGSTALNLGQMTDYGRLRAPISALSLDGISGEVVMPDMAVAA